MAIIVKAAIDGVAEHLNPVIVHDAITGERKTYFRYEDVMSMLESLAKHKENIVQCYECRHNSRPKDSPYVDCKLFYGMSDPYGFCHKGVKRESKPDKKEE